MSLKFYNKYGDPFAPDFEKKYMAMYDTPPELEIGSIPKRVYCNKDFAFTLDFFFRLLKERGIAHQIVTWDGCYNRRVIRGYEKKYEQVKKTSPIDAMKYLSVHSWGCAFDINAAWNQLGKPSTLSKDMVQAGKDAGLTWGGLFKRIDPMHWESSI